MARTRWIAMVGITTLVTAVAARGQSAYTVVVLQPASGGYDKTYGSGIAQGQAVGHSDGTLYHPLLWNGSAASMVDLLPTGSVSGEAIATDGTHQVGMTGKADGSIHATVWTGGVPSSAVDLHPAGFENSEADGVAGNQAVGYAAPPSSGGLVHAMVWDLTTGGATDLHPAGFDTTFANATDGTYQVGHGILAGGISDGQFHALLWSGSAGSVVDLNPAPNMVSVAHGIFGDQIVGSTNLGAALWVGPDHKFVNLGGGTAYATNGIYQVGVAYGNHAVRWSGTAGSILDLQQFLSAEFQLGPYPSSAADSIDAAGNIVGEALGPNGWEAVMWVPVVPEPGIIAAALAGMALPLLRSSGRGRRVTDAEPTSR